MAIVLEQREDGYERYSVGSGDALAIRFEEPTLTGWNLVRTIAWMVSPATGASVAVHFSFGPNLVYVEHGAHDEIDERTGYVEDTPISALRFTATGGSATIEIRSSLRMERL